MLYLLANGDRSGEKTSHELISPKAEHLNLKGRTEVDAIFIITLVIETVKTYAGSVYFELNTL